jgi:hypothetical protein
MRIRSPKDFWSGLIFVGTATGFILLSLRYNVGDMHRMGPALFPIIVAVLLGALGTIIAARSLGLSGPPVPAFHARPILVSLAAMILFGVALDWHGLIAAIAVLVIVGSYASPEADIPTSVAMASGLILFSIAIFVWLLGLPIPLWPGQ